MLLFNLSYFFQFEEIEILGLFIKVKVDTYLLYKYRYPL